MCMYSIVSYVCVCFLCQVHSQVFIPFMRLVTLEEAEKMLQSSFSKLEVSLLRVHTCFYLP